MIKNHYFFKVLALICLALAIFAVNSPVIGPMIAADEHSHLMNAAAIAGYHNDFASSYHGGYSLLLSPAFIFANSPEQAWLFVQIINAVLYLIGVLFLLLLAERVYQGSSRFLTIVATFSTAVYPMWVIMAGYAFAQIAFFTFFVVLTYLVLRAIDGDAAFWPLSGLMAGFLYWVHPTGLAVGIALSLAVIYEYFSKKKISIVLITIASIIAMIMIYKVFFLPWLHGRMMLSGVGAAFHYPQIINAIKAVLDLDGVIEFLSRLAGHIFYLTIGTLGLIWASYINIFNVKKGLEIAVPNTLITFLTLSLLGVLFLSVLLFSSSTEANRLDHWIYGRYVEGVIAPLVLFGAMTVVPKTQWVSLSVAMITGLLLMYGITDYGHTARMNVGAFWQDFKIRDAGLHTWILSGVGLILLSLVMSRFSRFAALGFIGFVFVWMSSLQLSWHDAAAKDAASRYDLAKLIRLHYAPGDCVGFDQSGIDSYNKHVFWFYNGFQLYDYAFLRMTASDWRRKCDGPLFSYDDKLDEKFGLYLIGKSPKGGPNLWSRHALPILGTYPFIVQNRSRDLDKVLYKGWHDMESRHVWSEANAMLKLLVPKECNESYYCEAVVSFAVFGATPARNQEVIFSMVQPNQHVIDRMLISNQGFQTVAIPLTTNDNYLFVSVDVPDATSPSLISSSTDSRVLGISLTMIELKKIVRK